MPRHESESIARGFELWLDAMRWQRTVDLALREHELTHTQYLVLASTLLLTEPLQDAVPQQAIAEHAGIDKATTSRLSAALAERGLLDRGPTLGDARAWRVIVTARGRALLLRATRDVELAAEDFFAA